MHTFHCGNNFQLGEVRSCITVSSDPMYLWIISNSCPLNSVLVRSHQAEIIIVKRLISSSNNLSKVRVKPRSLSITLHKNAFDLQSDIWLCITPGVGHCRDIKALYSLKDLIKKRHFQEKFSDFTKLFFFRVIQKMSYTVPVNHSIKFDNFIGTAQMMFADV